MGFFRDRPGLPVAGNEPRPALAGQAGSRGTIRKDNSFPGSPALCLLAAGRGGELHFRDRGMKTE